MSPRARSLSSNAIVTDTRDGASTQCHRKHLPQRRGRMRQTWRKKNINNCPKQHPSGPELTWELQPTTTVKIRDEDSRRWNSSLHLCSPVCDLNQQELVSSLACFWCNVHLVVELLLLLRSNWMEKWRLCWTHPVRSSGVSSRFGRGAFIPR